jgi:hypothetical protein
MQDLSALDKKYFIDDTVYNCPFCNRRNVVYKLYDHFVFDWSENKKCFAYLVQCSSCKGISMHLSYEELRNTVYEGRGNYRFNEGVDLDSFIFYSVPTSFFVIDNRIPRIIRELISEAEGCLKMNYLTGASACMRKAIYELLVYELLVLDKAEGTDYDSRIKSLKQKHPDSDPGFFDILAHIQGMTSEKIHEQSWDKWDSKYLTLIIDTLKSVLHDIYVLPKIKEERSLHIQKLQADLKRDKK